MPTLSKVDPGFENCKVLTGSGKWVRGRYKFTRSDGLMLVEISTGHYAKTRKFFPECNVNLYEDTKVVFK